jgi:predicted dehydrogenase
MLAIVDAGEIGTVRHLEAHFCIPLILPGDIRWRRDLAGGALMDTGCYTVSLLRHLARAEPEVVRASSIWTRGGVDRFTEADLRFPGDRTARLTTSLLCSWLIRATVRVEGTTGGFWVLNPIAPQIYHRLSVRTPAGTRTEHVAGPASYEAQLVAFVAAVRDGVKVPTDAADAVLNMRTIDRIYAAAGRAA